MTDAEVVELLEVLAESGVVVGGRLDVRASRDPGDDIILAAIPQDARSAISALTAQ